MCMLEIGSLSQRQIKHFCQSALRYPYTNYKTTNLLTINLTLTGDEGDIVVSDTEGAYIIWAIGKLDKDLKPTFHRLYPKHNIKINFNRKPEELNCQAFTSVQHPKRYGERPEHLSYRFIPDS